MERYTLRQQEILAMVEGSNGVGYQQLIYDAALEIWEAIRQNIEGCALSAQEVIFDLSELANSRLGLPLSKPREEYDPIAARVLEILHTQGHSWNSFHCTIIELTKVIKDFTGQPVSALGLRNGAVIEILTP